MTLLPETRALLESSLDRVFPFGIGKMNTRALSMAEWLFGTGLLVVAGETGFARWAMERACGCTHVNSKRYSIQQLADGRWGIGMTDGQFDKMGAFRATRGTYETREAAIEGAKAQKWHDGEYGFEFVVIAA